MRNQDSSKKLHNILTYTALLLLIGCEFLWGVSEDIREQIPLSEFWPLASVFLLAVLAVLLLLEAGFSIPLKPSAVFWIGWLLCFVSIIAVNFIHPAGKRYLLWALLSLTIFPIIMAAHFKSKDGLRPFCDKVCRAMTAGSFLFAALNFVFVPFIRRAPLVPLDEFLGLASNPNTNGILCSGFAVAAIYLLVTDHKRKLLYSVSLGLSLSFVVAAHCRSAKMGLLLAAIAAAAYVIRTKGLPDRAALKSVVVIIVVSVSVCIISGQALLYIDGIYLKGMDSIGEAYYTRFITEQEEFYKADAEANADSSGADDQHSAMYDRINQISSERLMIWSVFIPRIRPLGNGKTDEPLTNANRMSFSAHNNVLEVLYISGWPAGIGFCVWLLYGLFSILKNIIVKKEFQPALLLFILSFPCYWSIAMLDVMQYPFQQSIAFMAYVSLSAVAFGQDPSEPGYRVVKRLFDIFVGLTGCILLIPVIPIVRIMQIRTDDHGPLFFSQTRVGCKGWPFRLYKFRSMIVGAEDSLEDLLENEKYRNQWKEKQKLENDPRVTKAGKVLRHTAMDELPQFWNILKGDMSLVGPRPLVPGELEAFGGDPLYMSVRPGMTGWWICNRHHDTSYSERLELEYYYIRNRSLSLDLLIIVRTVASVWKNSEYNE